MITEVLNTIQVQLNAPKDKYNTFGKYHYRSCEGILEGVKPLLEITKSSILLNDEILMVGSRVYVKSTATLKWGEEEISVSAFAREPDDKKGMDESQITGAASSYARKYALNGLFAIDDNKDSDTDEFQTESNNRSESEQKTAQKAKKTATDAIKSETAPIAPAKEKKPTLQDMPTLGEYINKPEEKEMSVDDAAAVEITNGEYKGQTLRFTYTLKCKNGDEARTAILNDPTTPMEVKKAIYILDRAIKAKKAG